MKERKKGYHFTFKRHDSWTEEEDDLLSILYPAFPNEEIAHFFSPKTVLAVRNRAFKLRLKKAERFWSWEDEQFIIQNHKVMNVVDMAKHLNRSPGAVSGKRDWLKKKGRL